MNKSFKPKVSVIIPAYNRADTVGRAIQSVLNQTFQDFEIIVADDGSTDGTEKVVKGFSDNRIQFIRRATNGGAAAARNSGLEAARGEYVALLDSDDEWLPEKLQEQMNLFRDGTDKPGVSCTDYLQLTVSPEGNIACSERVSPRAKSWFKKLLMGCGVAPGATLMASKSCFDDVGLFDEELPRYEDWDWLIRCTRKYELTIVEKPLARVYYRSARPSSEVMERSTIPFMEKNRRNFEAFGSCYRRKVVAKRWLELTWHFYNDGRYSKGNRYFIKAIKENPFERRLLGLCFMLIDGGLGTSIVPWALKLKRRLFRR